MMTTRWSMTINHDNDDHADDEMIATVWVCNPHHPHQLAMSQIQNEPKTSHWHSPASRFSLVSFPRSIVKDDLRVEEVQVACPHWGPEFEYRRARPHSWGWQKRSWGTVVRLHPLSHLCSSPPRRSSRRGSWPLPCQHPGKRSNN